MECCAAYRAAGQAVAALWRGAEIDHVEINGVAINWPAMPACGRPRSEVIADIAIGLGGVVAVERHRFGWPPAEDTVAAWNFDEDQAADFSEATSLALAIDPTGADDVLFLAWCEALNFALEHWREIETVAMPIQRNRRLTGDEVEAVAAGPFWRSVIEPGMQRHRGVPWP